MATNSDGDVQLPDINAVDQDVFKNNNAMQPLAVLPSPTDSVHCVCFSPDGKTLAMGSRNGRTILWETNTWTSRVELSQPTGVMFHLAFSPNSELLATASYDKVARVWAVETGHLITAFPGPSMHVDFSPDGSRLVTTHTKKAHLWNVSSGQLLCDLVGHSSKVNFALISPNNTQILTSSGKQAFRWSAVTGELLSALPDCRGQINDLKYSSDGSLIAAACFDKYVRIWDANTGNLLHQLPHDDHCFSIVFTSDGRHIACDSFNNTLRIWNTTTGENTFTFIHPHRVGGVSTVANTNLVLTSGWVWNVSTGRLHTRLNGGGSCSPDGRHVATGAPDGNTYIWALP